MREVDDLSVFGSHLSEVSSLLILILNKLRSILIPLFNANVFQVVFINKLLGDKDATTRFIIIPVEAAFIAEVYFFGIVFKKLVFHCFRRCGSQ